MVRRFYLSEFRGDCIPFLHPMKVTAFLSFYLFLWAEGWY
jgi:hypothetical protein